MPNHEEIYKNEALQYDELIARQPGLATCIEEICPLGGLDVLDMGAGSGRLTTALANKVRSIIATDASESMLRVTADRLRASGLVNWGVATADHRRLPLEDHCVDLIVSGWSICYLCHEDEPDWRTNLRLVMEEIKRVARSGGTAILFETMGTGTDTPDPPAFLLPYYKALEEEYGFQFHWIRMDYAFDDVAQAERLTRFFFGDELADKVVSEGITKLPECAGVWQRRF